MGTRRGNVYILDFNGNMNQAFAKHDNVVTELSIDDRGEFIASSSLSGMELHLYKIQIILCWKYLILFFVYTGKVVIHSVFAGSSDSSSFSFKRPILSVALEPDYYKSNTKEFVVGGRSEELILSKKGWKFNVNTFSL